MQTCLTTKKLCITCTYIIIVGVSFRSIGIVRHRNHRSIYTRSLLKSNMKSCHRLYKHDFWKSLPHIITQYINPDHVKVNSNHTVSERNRYETPRLQEMHISTCIYSATDHSFSRLKAIPFTLLANSIIPECLNSHTFCHASLFYILNSNISSEFETNTILRFFTRT